jgi:HK97 family phage major capsid protein
MSEWLRATRRFLVQDGAENIVIERGEYVVDDHPIARRHADAFVSDAEYRENEIRSALDNGTVENGAEFTGTDRRTPTRDTSPLGQVRTAGLRAVERSNQRGALTDRGAEVLEDLIRRDSSGADAEYVRAVSDPDYERAFYMALARPHMTGSLSAREQEALHRAVRATEQRAMSVGTPGAGGYGVPIAVDPTMNIVNDGQINPLRQLATVRQVATSELRLVNTEGVTAAFAQEGAEVADGTPTLTQPTLVPERAHAFVPFSWETGQDYPSLLAELGRLLADGKDVLEADKFVNGAGHGSNEPEGLLTGLDVGTVSGGSASVAVFYSAAETLPPRYSPRASWLSSLAAANYSRRLVAEADADEPAIWNDAGDRLLGKPWFEVSDMPASYLTAQAFVYGSISEAFTIVDRLGMSVSAIPHLFGGSGRPTGISGLYAFWRTTSGTVNPNAARALDVS